MATLREHHAPTRRCLGCLTALLLLLAATSVARAGDRVELVMFESAACEWCDLWRTEIGPVYAKSDEGRTAPLRIVSIHAKKPADLKAISGVVYTPTFVLWDGEREIGRIVGYSGEIQFWGLLEVLLKKRTEQRVTPTAPPPSASHGTLHATPIEPPR